MKTKTQVDMVNLNTKTFSFYDLLSNFGQFCAANFVCAILRKIGSYFLKVTDFNENGKPGRYGQYNSKNI